MTLKAPSDEADTPLVSEFPLVNKEIVVAVDAQGKPVALDDDRRPVRTVNPQDTSTVIPETGIFYSLIARPGFAPQLQSLDLKSGSGVTTLVTKESLPPDVLTGLRTQLLTALASQSE